MVKKVIINLSSTEAMTKNITPDMETDEPQFLKVITRPLTDGIIKVSSYSILLISVALVLVLIKITFNSTSIFIKLR